MVRKLSLLVLILLAAGYNLCAQAPVAKINALPTAICPGQAISFTDASTGGAATSWSWTFPGGIPATSTAKSAAVVFNTAGNYTATLTVKNASGSSSTTQSITVYSSPVADFTQNKTTGCFPTYVQFTNTSAPGAGASISSYSWSFGDGTQDTVASPNHRYTIGGSLPVTLYVKNNFGCLASAQIKNVQKAITLTGQVIPNFNSTLNSSCNLPVTAQFTNTSTGPPVLSYLWNFGDGSPTDNSANPSHPYTTAGSYPVSLAITSSQGCSDTLITKINITANGNLTDFTMPDTVCVNAPVNFTNVSSPFPNSSTWNYGDGSPIANSRNGSHTYTVTGSYPVTLTNSFPACGGVQTKNILVVAPPTTSFTGTNTTSCKPPLTSTFTDASTGASSWTWDFGDGSPKINGKTPAPHTYTTYGDFNVVLTSSSAAGCSTSKNLPVKIDKPIVKLAGMPAYGCAPYIFTPAASTTTIDGVASYNWDFGNGNTSSSATPPPQTYAVGSSKIVITIITNGGCQAKDSGIVKVGSVKPVPSFTFVPPTACIKSAVTFTGVAPGSDQWAWDFGDGSVDTKQNTVYKYLKPGTYHVRFTAYNSGCWDSVGQTIVVDPPLADFSYTTACGAKNNYSFTDKSTGATGWAWDFGDASGPSAIQNPTHSYAAGAPVTLTVRLIASSATCKDTALKTINVNQTTTLTFSTNPVCVNIPVTITAKPPTGSNIGTYIFVFGDGSYDTTNNNSVSHTYTLANPAYPVKVITKDMTTGCIDSSAAFTLKVNGPSALFTSPATLSCGPLKANFTDLSTVSPAGASIVKWAWDFGDGGTSTVKNPSYTYAVQGNFVPTLTVTDNNGCSSSYDSAKAITVSIMTPSFTTNDTLSCPNAPTPTKFNNTSVGGFNPIYSWDFGDGSPIDNAISPVHTYTSVGRFWDSLTMKDSYGCTSKIGNLPINIDTPHASFTMSGNYSACPVFNDFFTFTGHYAKTYSWDFTDGGISNKQNPVNGYALPGDYWPQLTIRSPGGCVAVSDSQHVHVDGPLGTFTYSPLAGCDSLTVNFNVATTNVISFTWIPGDGSDSTRTTTPNYSHKYTTPGQWTPIVYLTDAGGCRLSKVGNDFINVDAITSTSFKIDNSIVCDTGTVNFTNTSVVGNGTNITNYAWDFGDGSTISGIYPTTSHKYTTVGNDSVSLTLSSYGGCTSTLKLPLYVVASPNISISGLLSQCAPATLNFAGNELVTDPYGPLNWAWDFGNGQKATVQTPPAVNYPKAGEYVVYLKATNSKGCSTMTDTAGPATHLFIYPIPNVNAGPDVTICDTSNLQLLATGDATSYYWLPPVNGTLSCTACTNPIATSPVTTYFVVEGTTLFGCQARDTVDVTVNTQVTVTASGTDSVCLGLSTPLQASGASIYSWTPAEGLSNPDIANPIATPDANQIGAGSSNVITYTVTGYDSKKCYSDTRSVDVTAFKYPSIGLANNATINVGSSYAINATVTTNIVSLNWTPSNTLSCSNCLTPTAAPTMTTNYLLTAINDGGCVSKDSVHVQVICNGANFFVPNTFSPNGDGANDVFMVRGVGLSIVPSITIFNRWGQIVFQKSNFPPNDPSSGWDGTFNGKPAPPDVYIYTIQIFCENSTLIPYHGNITLIR